MNIPCPERVILIDTVTRRVSEPTPLPASFRLDHVTCNGYCIGFDHTETTPTAILNGHLVPRHIAIWHPDHPTNELPASYTNWFNGRSRLKKRPTSSGVSRFSHEHLRRGRRESKLDDDPKDMDESEIYEDEDEEVDGDGDGEGDEGDIDLDEYEDKENVD